MSDTLNEERLNLQTGGIKFNDRWRLFLRDSKVRTIFASYKSLHMKNFLGLLFCLAIASTLLSGRVPGKSEVMADQLRGSWMHQSGDVEQVLLFIDGYSTETVYSKSGKKFIETRGGTYNINANNLNIVYEFDTRDKEQTGQPRTYGFSIKNNELTINAAGKTLVYKKIEEGSAPLAGLWSITSRMQDGKVVPIHRTGTRKTIKILSGARFQWAAIDPGQKQFSGTGGGRYEFAIGKYTEHIEFFSRDSSRVGASLSFDGKLENGEWHHSGKSSKGDAIYEIWSKDKN